MLLGLAVVLLLAGHLSGHGILQGFDLWSTPVQGCGCSLSFIGLEQPEGFGKRASERDGMRRSNQVLPTFLAATYHERTGFELSEQCKHKQNKEPNKLTCCLSSSTYGGA